MNKKWAILMALMLLLTTSIAPTVAQEEARLSILVTTFPLYDWTRNILGERLSKVDLTLLQDSGADLHSFQPSVEDVVAVSTADVLIFVGGPSDKWVEDALKGVENERLLAVNLMESLGDGVKTEVSVEGMQESNHDQDHDHDDDHDDDHDHDHDHEHEHEHEGEEEAGHREHQHADEHIWLSLKNAQVLVKAISATLSQADPANSAIYEKNASLYMKRLQDLDAQYTQAIAQKEQKVLLFGDRFPFHYLMDDYGITYYAAFSGCSAESEASFETIAFLSDKVDSLNLKAVLKLDGSNGRIAQAIVRTSQSRSQEVLELNAIQFVTPDMVESGVSYLSIMEDNLKVILQAL